MAYRFAARLALLLPLSVLICITPSRADDIPSFQVLSCEHDCPKFVWAKPLAAALPVYPHEDRRDDNFVEALVDVDFTIATDGSVQHPVIEYLIGPQEFSDSVLAAVAQRRYEPATEDGKPVEENHRVRYVFRITNAGPGGRATVVEAYHHAVSLADDGKSADAIAALNELVARPRLNFYERTMAAYALAVLDAKAGDYWSGRAAIRMATIDQGRFLDEKSIDGALRLRIRLEAACGDLAESLAWYEILKRHSEIKPDDSIAQVIVKLHELIDGPAPLTSDARIPLAGEPAFWQHTLLKRSFQFQSITGKLDRFDLLCARHSIRSAVSDKANWTVPSSWSSCVVNVSGQPGTKFQLVELPPEK